MQRDGSSLELATPPLDGTILPGKTATNDLPLPFEFYTGKLLILQLYPSFKDLFWSNNRLQSVNKVAWFAFGIRTVSVAKREE